VKLYFPYDEKAVQSSLDHRIGRLVVAWASETTLGLLRTWINRRCHHANVKETRKNVTTKELQQRFTATKMADKTIQYDILARKHACAYYDINAAGTACWRNLFSPVNGSELTNCTCTRA